MDTNEKLAQLEERVKQLGIEKLEKKIARLEERGFFFFFRVRFLLRKVRLLKGRKK